MCFPVSFAKFLRALFLTEKFRWLIEAFLSLLKTKQMKC